MMPRTTTSFELHTRDFYKPIAINFVMPAGFSRIRVAKNPLIGSDSRIVNMYWGDELLASTLLLVNGASTLSQNESDDRYDVQSFDQSDDEVSLPV